MNGLRQAQAIYDRRSPEDGNGRSEYGFGREKEMPVGAPVICSVKWIELPESGEKKGEK